MDGIENSSRNATALKVSCVCRRREINLPVNSFYENCVITKLSLESLLNSCDINYSKSSRFTLMISKQKSVFTL